MFRGKRVAARVGVVVDDPSGDEGCQPFADVPLLQAGPRGKLLTRRSALGEGSEQAGPVAEVDHVRQHAARVVPEELTRELLHSGLVYCARVAHVVGLLSVPRRTRPP
jgi:hypothetical protein